VTFDRGDVEHFISEAVKLNDAGTTNYQTIVAGEAICLWMVCKCVTHAGGGGGAFAFGDPAWL